jgi:phosphatidylinositol alpha 1,6-mannosyltransferase
VRICHISDCYLPRLGGIEVQVSELARRQAAAGHDVHVITATPGHEVREGVEEIDGVTVHRVTAKMPFELPVHPRTRHNVSPLLGRLNPDIVHVHLGVISPFAWGGIRAAVTVDKPVLATVHSVWGGVARSGYGATNALSKWTEKGVQPAAVSRVAANRIAAALPPDIDVLITPNGVDPDDWNASGRTLPDPSRPPSEVPSSVSFVTAMRLAPRKRAMPLLEMFSAALPLIGSATSASLGVAGDGPQRARLESFIEEQGLRSRVHLLGRLSRPDLQQLYLDSDVFIQPSVKESFGLAALEARSTGLPVIARSQTGLTEFVRQGVEGLLADTDTAMIDAIVTLALDTELRDRITRHNVTVPPDQTWPDVLAQIEAAYDLTRQRLRLQA